MRRGRIAAPCADSSSSAMPRRSPAWSDDYERRLTDHGRGDAAIVARALAARNLLPDALIHSGAARARETAEVFAAVWGGKVPFEVDDRLYDASAGRCSRLLARWTMPATHRFRGSQSGPRRSRLVASRLGRPRGTAPDAGEISDLRRRDARFRGRPLGRPPPSSSAAVALHHPADLEARRSDGQSEGMGRTASFRDASSGGQRPAGRALRIPGALTPPG